jgi:hypothetical protein
MGVTGTLCTNGKPRDNRIFHKLSCYITQEDLIQPLLTVQEMMTVAAQLKLPSQTSEYRRLSMVIYDTTQYTIHYTTYPKTLLKSECYNFYKRAVNHNWNLFYLLQWDCNKNNKKLKKTKLHGLSPRANYTDRATAACRRSPERVYILVLHNTLYTIHYTTHNTLYTIHYTTHNTLYTIDYTKHNTQYTIHNTLHNTQYTTQHTIHYTTHNTLYTIYYTTHNTLYTIHYTTYPRTLLKSECYNYNFYKCAVNRNWNLFIFITWNCNNNKYNFNI